MINVFPAELCFCSSRSADFFKKGLTASLFKKGLSENGRSTFGQRLDLKNLSPKPYQRDQPAQRLQYNGCVQDGRL